MREPQIIQLVSTYPPYRGGTGAVAYELARRWPQLHTRTPEYGGRRDTDPRTTYLRPLIRIGNGAVVPQAAARISTGDTVILHYPFFGGGEYVALARLFRRFKLIVYYHQDLVPPPDLLRSVLFRIYTALIFPLVVRVAHRVAVSSLDYARGGDLAPYIARYPEKFVEVPPGVDADRFTPLAGAAAECTAVDARVQRMPSPLFVTVAALDPAHWFKGIDVLLRAFAQTAAGSLAVVGDGDLRQSLEAEATRLGIADRVAFLGGLSRQDLNCLFNRAYMSILPSVTRSEAFGLVQLESLAAGIPVLASDLPGVRTVAAGCGMTVAPGDVQAWAAAIAECAAQPDRRLAWALAARRRALEYSWSRAVELMQSL